MRMPHFGRPPSAAGGIPEASRRGRSPARLGKCARDRRCHRSAHHTAAAHAFDVPVEGALARAGVSTVEIDQHRAAALRMALAAIRGLSATVSGDPALFLPIVERGRAARLIMEYEHALSADLVVIGKRTFGKRERLERVDNAVERPFSRRRRTVALRPQPEVAKRAAPCPARLGCHGRPARARVREKAGAPLGRSATDLVPVGRSGNRCPARPDAPGCLEHRLRLLRASLITWMRHRQ